MSHPTSRARRLLSSFVRLSHSRLGLTWFSVFAMISLARHLFAKSSEFVTNPEKVARQVKNQDEPDFDEYDIIIVGGGTAGCVLVARLSEDPKVRVLLLESGGSGKSLLFTRIPSAYSLLFHTKHVYNMWTEPQPFANDKRKFWPRGKMLGGCSSINAQMAQYGSPQDFDEWAKIIGDDSWGWRNFRQYFTKLETYKDDPAYPEVDSSQKGTKGPVRVGYFTTVSQASKDFIKTCPKLGIPFSPDFNSKSNTRGVNRIMTYVDEKGTRVSSETAYFTRDVRARTNLTLVIHATVTRIVFKKTNGELRATGVEFCRKKGGSIFRARAKREVIVSGGAVHSPQILMLSGVGSSSHLHKFGIPVLCDLPGVGSHLVDHPVVDMYFKDRHNVSTKHIKPRTLYEVSQIIGSTVQYLITRRGPLATNIGESAAFCRTDDPILFPPEDFPNKLQDSTSGTDAPDLEIFTTPFAYKAHGDFMFPMHTFSMHACLLRPISTGSLRLKSSDPWDFPLLDPGYLTAAEDVERLIRGLKLMMRISKVEPLASNLDLACLHPLLDSNMLQMTDKELEEIVRDRVETLYHPASTCRMAPLEMGGVVDSHLRVYGIKGLRVCDASIFPKIVSGHTAGAVLASAEHLADIIKAEATDDKM